MKYKRFVIITQDFYPAYGGINTYSEEIAKNLSKEGFEVVVVTKKYSNQMPFIELDEGYKIIRLEDTRWKKDKYKLIKNSIKQYIKEDTLFIGTNWKMSLPLRMMKFFKNIDYLTAVHGLDVFEGRKVNRLLQLMTFKGAKYISYASSYTKQFLTEYLTSKKNEIILNNGYDDANFYPDSDFQEIGNRYKIEKKKYVFCFGRLVERKGFDRTIEALRFVDDLKLVISGDGKYKNKLEDLTKEFGLESRVVFTGKLDQDSLRKLYSNALVYSMPSRLVGGWDFEGFGITYLEAAACSTASIGGVESGAIDAIIVNQTGFLVDPNSPDTIAEKIRFLYKNPIKREEIEKKALKRAREKFNWQKITKNLINFVS